MVIDRRYIARGGAAHFFKAEEKELLCESGAMTGKSLSLLRKADYTAWKHPGCRQFFARDTRKSLNESVLVEWETNVLWPGHPAFTGTATKEHRDSYTYPNGSVIVLTGLDNPDRVMSTQYDRGYVFEATEITLDDWEKLLSRMRNGKTPYHQLVADCNPGSEFHWLNQRFPKEGDPNPVAITDDEGNVVSMRRRIFYRHTDNPRLFDPKAVVNGVAETGWTKFGREYLAGTLGSMTGARRERLLFHKWVSEEGQIWPEFDAATHLIAPADVPECKAFVASKDFGYNAPGCLQVWGVDADNRAYRVAEIYQRGLSLDGWAAGAEFLWKRYKFDRGVADSAEPRSIDFLNDKIGAWRGRKLERVFATADKGRGKQFGIDHVRDCLRPDTSGRPLIRFVRGALWHVVKSESGWDVLPGPDPEFARESRPACTEQEIPSYVYLKAEDGKPIKELPDPARPNEGCDATEYFAVYWWKKDLMPAHKKWQFAAPPRGQISVADALGFAEIAIKEKW